MLLENQHELKQALASVKSPRILVVGDLMLDRYTWGSVSRISPEAPIPVLRVSREENRLGGAANAMSNLITLGAQVYACGVIGDDPNGEVVLTLFEQEGVDTSGVVQHQEFTTILKHRMIAGHHHLLRMDFDPPIESQQTCDAEIQAYLEKMLPEVDLVVVSDYGKGVLSESVLDCLRRLNEVHHLPIVVDPRRDSDYRIYRDFTLIKPNRNEASQAMHRSVSTVEDAVAVAQELQKTYNISHVVLSMDRDGLLLLPEQGKHVHFKAEAQEVFDVVGAGDMVVAVLSFLIAGGVSVEFASAWANLAAGMEIMHVGVVSFTKAELLQKMELGVGANKVVTMEQLVSYLENQPRDLIFTNGYFDDISAVHLKFLQQLQSFNGIRVVAINSDESIIREKGSAPLLNEQERASLLASIESVDWIIVFDEANANHLIEGLKPAVIVKGGTSHQQPIAEQSVIEAVGARLEYLPEYK